MHVRKAPALIALCCAIVLTSGVATPARAQAPGGPSPDSLVASQIELSRRIAPLHTAADAADALGNGSEGSVYSGSIIDAATNIVTIYLTDRAAETRFRRSISAAAGAAAPDQLRFATGRFSLRDLLAARTQLKQEAMRLGVVRIKVAPDGAGLTAVVRDADAARTGLANLRAAAGSTPLSILDTAGGLKIVVGEGLVPRSRTRDWAPWIAGAALSDWTTTQSNVYKCTSGLPARRKSDNHSFLVTAAHCFADGVDVHTGWSNGGRTYIGRVYNRRSELDAIIIDTAKTGVTQAHEWDGSADHIYDVTSSGTSQVGDMVCQDGFVSKIVCGLKVDHRESWIVDGFPNVLVDGWVAKSVNSTVASRGGDSGGLVFNYNNVTRQARGIVSTGGGTNDEELAFPDANDILSYFGMKLAPTTVP